MPEPLLNQIISDSLSSDSDVATLIRKVLLLGRRVRHEETKQWAQHELTGYPLDKPVPTYRGPHPLRIKGNWAHWGGWENQAYLSQWVFDDEQMNQLLYTISFRQPIMELQNIVLSGENLSTSWPEQACRMYQKAFEANKASGLQSSTLYSAYGQYSDYVLSGVIDSLKTAALTLAEELREVAPNAGEIEGPTISDPLVKERILQFQVFNYGGQNNIGQGENVHQQVTQHADNVQALIGQLQQQYGLEHEEANELVAAVRADRGTPGEATQSWLSKVRSGAVRVAEGVTASMISQGLPALLQQFPIP